MFKKYLGHLGVKMKNNPEMWKQVKEKKKM